MNGTRPGPSATNAGHKDQLNEAGMESPGEPSTDGIAEIEPEAFAAMLELFYGDAADKAAEAADAREAMLLHTGSMHIGDKMKLAAALSELFSACFVPGSQQMQYLRRFLADIGVNPDEATKLASSRSRKRR